MKRENWGPSIKEIAMNIEQSTDPLIPHLGVETDDASGPRIRYRRENRAEKKARKRARQRDVFAGSGSEPVLPGDVDETEVEGESVSNESSLFKHEFFLEHEQIIVPIFDKRIIDSLKRDESELTAIPENVGAFLNERGINGDVLESFDARGAVFKAREFVESDVNEFKEALKRNISSFQGLNIATDEIVDLGQDDSLSVNQLTAGLGNKLIAGIDLTNEAQKQEFIDSVHRDIHELIHGYMRSDALKVIDQFCMSRGFGSLSEMVDADLLQNSPRFNKLKKANKTRAEGYLAKLPPTASNEAIWGDFAQLTRDIADEINADRPRRKMDEADSLEDLYKLQEYLAKLTVPGDTKGVMLLEKFNEAGVKVAVDIVGKKDVKKEPDVIEAEVTAAPIEVATEELQDQAEDSKSRWEYYKRLLRGENIRHDAEAYRIRFVPRSITRGASEFADYLWNYGGRYPFAITYSTGKFVKDKLKRKPKEAVTQADSVQVSEDKRSKIFRNPLEHLKGLKNSKWIWQKRTDETTVEEGTAQIKKRSFIGNNKAILGGLGITAIGAIAVFAAIRSDGNGGERQPEVFGNASASATANLNVETSTNTPVANTNTPEPTNTALAEPTSTVISSDVIQPPRGIETTSDINLDGMVTTLDGLDGDSTNGGLQIKLEAGEDFEDALERHLGKVGIEEKEIDRYAKFIQGLNQQNYDDLQSGESVFIKDDQRDKVSEDLDLKKLGYVIKVENVQVPDDLKAKFNADGEKAERHDHQWPDELIEKSKQTQTKIEEFAASEHLTSRSPSKDTKDVPQSNVVFPKSTKVVFGPIISKPLPSGVTPRYSSDVSYSKPQGIEDVSQSYAAFAFAAEQTRRIRKFNLVRGVWEDEDEAGLIAWLRKLAEDENKEKVTV